MNDNLERMTDKDLELLILAIQTEQQARLRYNGKYVYVYTHKGTKERHKKYCVKGRPNIGEIWIGSFKTIQEANNAAKEIDSVLDKYVDFRKSTVQGK